MRLLKAISRILDGINIAAAILAGIMILFLVLAVSYEIVMRYFLDRPPIWTVEISRYALLYITFLGTAWVLKEEGHVRIDLVVTRLRPATGALLYAVTGFISALAFLVITWYSTGATLDDYRIWYRVESELRTPRFIILAIIPAGSFLFSLQFLRHSCVYFDRWRKERKGQGLAPKF